MSNLYNRKQTNILPRINSKIKIINNIHKSKKLFPKANANTNKNEIFSSLRNSKEKKPGTSINTKKPIYILPEIPYRKLSKTANIKTNNNNNDNDNVYNNDNYNGQIVNPINDIQKQNSKQNYFEKYENMALMLLENDEQLKTMFNELNENGNIVDSKKWLKDNLLQFKSNAEEEQKKINANLKKEEVH